MKMLAMADSNGDKAYRKPNSAPLLKHALPRPTQ